jgi:8-oxo-dGTP pyrophosphatase MutT (NUDIX family)
MSFPRHIVCVTGLIRDAEDRVLLIKSPRRGWELPGGQLEENESLPDGLTREVREETGFNISVHRLAGVYTARPQSLLIFAFSGAKESGSARKSAESLEVGWFPIPEARSLIEWPSMRVRFDDLEAFSGKVIYRVYNSDPFSVLSTSAL